MNRLFSSACIAALVLTISNGVAAQPTTTDNKTAPPPADDKAKPPPATEPAPPPPPATTPGPATPVVRKGTPSAPVDLKVSASFFTRYELRENYADIGATMGRFSEFDAFVYRARLGVATSPIDIGGDKTVGLRFVPQVSGFWADRGGTLVDSPLQLHEAVMRINSGKVWVDVGRFEMIYGDHLVIGNVGWHETARSFDGARARFPIGNQGAWLDAFFTYVAEGRLTGLTDTVFEGDQLFAGAYLALGPNIGKGTAVDGYLLANTYVGFEQDLSPELTLGGRYKARSGAIDTRVEAGVQFGKRPGDVSVFAFQGEGEVGFHTGPTRIAAGAFFASGDDPDTETDESWNQLFPTAHKFLGWMDVIGGRSNVLGGMAKLHYTASKKLGLGAHAHLFLRPQTAADSYTGIEVDTYAKHKIGKGLAARFGYHIFLPNETGPLGTDTPVHYVEITLGFTLK